MKTTDKTGGPNASEAREARLAKALRANLRRRKAAKSPSSSAKRRLEP